MTATVVHGRLDRLIDKIQTEAWENEFGQRCFLDGLRVAAQILDQEKGRVMILDTEVHERFSVIVSLDQSETPKMTGTGVHYMISPNKMAITWSRENGAKWVLEKITVIGPRVLKGNNLSDVVTGRRSWYGNPLGDHKIDPPSWVLSVINEVKPNGWKLETES